MSRAKIKIEKGKLVWALLLGLSFGMVCWYSRQFAKQFYTYKKLSSEGQAQVNVWGIEKLKEGKFVIYAKYSYQVRGTLFSGNTTFDKIIFSNQVAAHEHLTDWKADSWTVYYDPQKPSHSTLQRPFPLKILLHILIGVGISIYFLYLRRYLSAFGVA